MRRDTLVGFLLAGLCAACSTALPRIPPSGEMTAPVAEAPLPGVAVEEIPEAWRAAVDRGLAATSALGLRLRTRVVEVLQQGGPVAAIAACREDAAVLTAAVSDEFGIKLGRTSHRLRNAENQAPPWMVELVELASPSTGASPEARVFDLDDVVGLARPIPMATACLRCHGPRAQLDAEVLSVLAETYPADQAVDFEAGSLRGYMWAEIPLTVTIE